MSISASEWAQVEALFPEALELSADARPAFLARHCGNQPRVRAELEAMLAATVDIDDALLSAPVSLSLKSAAAVEALPPGSVLGDWRVKDLIGQGGMGNVYLAERADGAFVMQVAIKVLKRGLDTDAIVARFLRERRILAQLSHPRIARVLDAGACADGRPYLVLEYVHGVSILEYCRVRRLSIRATLGLFCAVCEAVDQAHHNLVVHRDLKPSNVLVDDGGEVKLLDFGIAKLLGADGLDSTRLGDEALPMTPAYAAPEQIRGEAISTATDVHALGVMLYQLLAGRLPFRREGLPSAVLAATLAQEHAEPPSVAVKKALTSFDAAEITQRSRQLAGDLDAILLKALHADPARRYRSAQGFANDLKCHLEQRPVLARPDSALYRSGRFLRRYRRPVAAAALALVALFAGLATALWQAGIARTAARHAEAESQRAERVKDFVLSVFREQDPSRRPGSVAMTPAELIAKGVARLDIELAAEPELHATLAGDLGEIQANLGDIGGGRALLERALKERIAQFGADSREAGETQRKLAWALYNEGRKNDAEPLMQAALAGLAARGDEDSLEAARLYLQLGFFAGYGRPGDAAALAWLERAQRGFEIHLGRNHLETTLALQSRASFLEQDRQDQQAEVLARDAISRYELGAPDSVLLWQPLVVLAKLLKRSGRYDEADQLYARAVAISRHAYGPRHKVIAEILASWAEIYRLEERYDDALRLFDEARAAQPESGSNNLAELLKARGLLYLEMGRFVDAERDLRESLALWRQMVGDGNGFTWYTASQWARALAKLGRLDEAERTAVEARSRLSAIIGADTYQNAFTAEALAEVLSARGDHPAAVELRREALRVTEAKASTNQPLIAQAKLSLATELDEVATPAARVEAGNLLDQVLAVLRPLSPHDRYFRLALDARAHLRRTLHDRTGAQADADEAAALAREALARKGLSRSAP